MKILLIGDKNRYEKFMPKSQTTKNNELTYIPRGSNDEEILKSGYDAEVIIADAISVVSAKVIAGMPNLKMIHSEGVAFNKIDVKAAMERKVYVCNNKGANAGAVAEQTILLMLGLLRFVLEGHHAVQNGFQMKLKEERMLSGITDLADCVVGLVGFGDIGKETAKRLYSFGCKCYYYNTVKIETEYHAEYKPLEELLPLCDIVSLHVPVTPKTEKMVNSKFLSAMKPGSYLINTSRGELVDQEALCEAILAGHIDGAGLDTLDPEPVTKDNPLVIFSEKQPYKVLFSPHVGGITTGSFMRMHKRIWENVERIAKGEKPECLVY